MGVLTVGSSRAGLRAVSGVAGGRMLGGFVGVTGEAALWAGRCAAAGEAGGSGGRSWLPVVLGLFGIAAVMALEVFLIDILPVRRRMVRRPRPPAPGYAPVAGDPPASAEGGGSDDTDDDDGDSGSNGGNGGPGGGGDRSGSQGGAPGDGGKGAGDGGGAGDAPGASSGDDPSGGGAD